MRTLKVNILFTLILLICLSCKDKPKKENIVNMQLRDTITAKDILGNPKYLAISYGGYRANTRDIQPTIAQLKEDMRILHAMGIKILRTYNTKLAHTSNLLKAIKALKNEDPDFEMYLMLGAWIDCENAWTANPNHDAEDVESNTAEIERAISMANKYPDIVKIIAVGNESMVKWAASYFVQPGVILKWVNHLQELKASGKLSKDLWITSSDNFASWGGGDAEYHVEDLNQLFAAVDYVSMHTYPMHDTHYNPVFWGVLNDEEPLSDKDQIQLAMLRAAQYAINQYQSVKSYMDSLQIKKPIHIGETGWASVSNGFYGHNGSKATDEYKAALYYHAIRDWTNKNGVSCFYFEAFDEPWKDAKNIMGSENHFGLFTVDGKAKYALWELVDEGVFKGLSRDGKPITKSYEGKEEFLFSEVLTPLIKHE